jgi:HD-like signal output (HDOD) protein
MSNTLVDSTRTAASVSSASLEEVAARISDVSTLPHVVQEILDVVNDPDSSASDLKNAVEMDPSLTARLLRTVNSAAYRARIEIRTVHHAIAYLGFTVVRNVALSSTVADIFKNDVTIGNYSRRTLWRHLVSVGAASRMIASRTGIRDFENAFLAGLLHDFGIILLDQNCHSKFVDTLESVEAGQTLCQAEERSFGFTHAEIGAAVARQWNLPSTAIAAMLHHHDAQTCSDDNRRVVEVVELANFICSCKGVSSIGIQAVRPPSKETLDSLSISREDFQVLWEDVNDDLGKTEMLTGM